MHTLSITTTGKQFIFTTAGNPAAVSQCLLQQLEPSATSGMFTTIAATTGAFFITIAGRPATTVLLFLQ